MKFSSIASVGLFLSCVQGGTFSQPVIGKKHSRSYSDAKGNHGELQQVLGKGNKLNGQSILRNGANLLGMPTQVTEWVLYTTSLGVGTPPQPFTAIIDLNWADLFVPSATCGGSHCSSKAKYNSSASSTHHPNGTIQRTTYGPIFAYGIISSDILTLYPSLQLPRFPFQELRYYERVYPDFGVDDFDAVLGLCPDQPFAPGFEPTSRLPSPFHEAVELKLLDRNIFALALPQNESDVGDLTFGGMNEDHYTGELISHALYPANTTHWQIRASGISLSSHASILINSSGSYTAFLFTSGPFIGLPYPIGSQILSHLPLSRGKCNPVVIPCSLIPSLPDITLSFPGQDVAIKGQDYVVKINNTMCPEPVEECVPVVEAMPEGFLGEGYEDYILVGSAFLKGLYSVFNWDERSVSFATRKM